jgi:hypothetical protein
MQSSKHLAVMFLLGATLVGGALGFTADRVWGREATCRDPRSSKALLYDRLELSDVQRAAWDSILDDRHRQFDSLFKPIKPQMDSIRTRGRAQIRALLTPEQRERFETILREPRASDKADKTDKTDKRENSK